MMAEVERTHISTSEKMSVYFFRRFLVHVVPLPIKRKIKRYSINWL